MTQPESPASPAAPPATPAAAATAASAHLGYTIVTYADVAAAVGYYEAAFGLRTRPAYGAANGPPQWIEFDTGATTLAFSALALERRNFGLEWREHTPGDVPAAFHVGFIVPDVPAAFRRAIAAGGTALTEPNTKPWGQTEAAVRDPWGVVITLLTPPVR